MNGKEGFINFYKKNLNLENEDFENFIKILDTPLPITFRVNRKSIHKNKIESKLLKYGNLFKKVDFIENVYQLNESKSVLKKDPNYREFREFLISQVDAGNISRQELVSMIPVNFMDLKHDSLVIDMCASPGSKSIQILEIIDDAGLLISNDSNSKRVEMLITQTSRIPLSSHIITQNDASIFPKIIIDGEVLKYDRVLCDVPCSGDGTIRKNRNVLKNWNYRSSVGLFSLQSKILKRGSSMVKDSGILVYSTCSFNPIENECVIQKLLLEGEFELVNLDCGTLKHRNGLQTWTCCDDLLKNKDFLPTNENLNLERCIRIYPHDQNTGGFFIAVLKKKDKTIDFKITESSEFLKKGENIKEPEKLTIKRSAVESENNVMICKNIKNEAFYEVNPSLKKSIENYYKVNIKEDLVTQSKTAASLSILSTLSYKILKTNTNSLNIIAIGFKAFAVNNFKDSSVETYRAKSSFLDLYNNDVKSNINVGLEDFKKLLDEEFVPYEKLNIQFSLQGCVIIGVNGFDDLYLCGWSSKVKLGIFLDKKVKAAMKKLIE